jgi:hypothetical protein
MATLVPWQDAPQQAPASTVKMSSVVGAGGNSDYFDSLPEKVKPLMNQLLEGRLGIGRMGVDKNLMTRLMIEAPNIDPAFDNSTFANRKAIRLEYASQKNGTAGANMTSLNTAIHHLTNLYDDYQGLNNGNTPWVNRKENELLAGNFGGMGDSVGLLKNKVAKQQFYGSAVDADANAVSEELAKVFRASGMSVQEVDAWKSKINQNMTPAEMKGVIGSAIKLMQGRFDPLVNNYNNALNTKHDQSFFMTQKANEDYARVRAGTATPDSAYIPSDTKASSPAVTIVRTGMYGGKKVTEYSDGSIK